MPTEGGVPLRAQVVLASSDVLTVGISFAFLEVDILGAVLAIGVTTLDAVAGWRGRRPPGGGPLPRPAEIVGGAILILIGPRILVDHLGVILSP